MFNDNTTLAQALAFNRPVAADATKPQGLISDDFIGVEIELENANYLFASLADERSWNIHDDGSLRDAGKEFTFARPFGGGRAESLLQRLSQTAHALPANRKPHISPRTSVHVHVDCTDLDTTSLARMLAVYMIYESAIFHAFAPERLGNHFALPFNDIIANRSIPRMLSRGWEDFSEQYNTEANNRYCALNIKSLFKFGTVEFRHLGGEYDYAKLLTWINCCLSFKHIGKSDINLRELFFMNSAGGFIDHTKSLFPPDVAEKLITSYKTPADFNADIISGIRVAQCALSPRVRF